MNDYSHTRTADRTLDAIGLLCPLPMLKARKILSRMPPGQSLLVEASDPMAWIDIPHLCRQDGHRLLAQERSGTEPDLRLRFWIERANKSR